MMRFIFLIYILLQLLPTVGYTQVDSLAKQVEKALQEANMPYKDVKGIINLQYKIARSALLTIETKPHGIIDQKALQNVLKQIPIAQYEHLDSVKIYTYFDFDEYTGQLFFGNWSEIEGPNMMINYSVSPANARRGQSAFLERWVGYLYLHLSIDSTIRSIDHDQVRWLHFLVERDGSLHLEDRNQDVSFLMPFLHAEQNWHPAVRGGRTTRTRVSLAFPAVLPPSKFLSKQDRETLSFQDDYVIQLEGEPVYFTANQQLIRDNINLISVVNNHKEVSAAVYHKGNIEQCEEIEKRLRESGVIRFYANYFHQEFNRLYFYTYQE